MKQLVSALLFIVFYASVALAADRMRIAYSSISGAYIGIWAAREAGFFAKENLVIRLFLFPGRLSFPR
jgi:ABC-type nitrate/sulfonate/bicarbonate transport system substrate-binding protein